MPSQAGNFEAVVVLHLPVVSPLQSLFKLVYRKMPRIRHAYTNVGYVRVIRLILHKIQPTLARLPQPTLGVATTKIPCFLHHHILQTMTTDNDSTNDNESSSSFPTTIVVPRMRRQFNFQEKMSLVRRIDQIQEMHGQTISRACSAANINPKQYRTWTKEFNRMKMAKNQKARSFGIGADSTLQSVKDDLL